MKDMKEKDRGRYRNMLALGIVFVLTIGALTLCSIYEPQATFKNFYEGDVSYQTIYAPFDFAYESVLNMSKWNALKKEAMEAVPDIYVISANAKHESHELLNQVFNLFIPEGSFHAKLSFPERFTYIRERLPVDLSDTQLRMFLTFTDTYPQKLKELQQEAESLIDEIYRTGLWRIETALHLLEQNKEKILIADSEHESSLREVKIEEIYTIEDIEKYIHTKTIKFLPDSPRMRSAYNKIIRSVLKINLVYDPKKTLIKKENAAKHVPPQYSVKEVKKGEQIIQKGQRFTKEHMAQVIVISKMKDVKKKMLYVWGHLLMISLLVLLCMIALFFIQPSFFSSFSPAGLLLSLTVFLAVLARIIFLSPFSSYMVPFAAGAMLASSIFGFRISCVYTLFICLLTGIFMLGNFYTGLVGIFGGLVGAYMMRGVRHRVEILKSGFFVGLMNSIAIFGVTAMHNMTFPVMVQEAVWGLFNGIISAGAVMLLLPIMEHLFGVATNVSLLELCDMQHPLLKEMFLKAHGTYHHSLVVSSLVEAASEVIGANTLLAKVGTYFHDIGKMEHPEYFTENQQEGVSTHDALNPSLSSLIIIDHVKKGKELALKYKLKKPIIDMILQHHGTSVVTYFYQKALSRKEEGDLVAEQEYRYPGPKPQTKEAAILLLADAVEAASRSIHNPTPAKLQDMVRKIINSKFVDGQLDECELTLKDIHKIGDVFFRVLIGVYHSRIEYPDEHISQKSSK